MPTVSLHTVYRTLWLLTDRGLFTTLGPRQGSVGFDENTTPPHHYLCLHCERVRDFESNEFNALPIPNSVNSFGRIVSTPVEVHGICDPCAKKLSRPAARESQGAA